MNRFFALIRLTILLVGGLAALASCAYPAAGPATVSVLDGLSRQACAWQPTLALGASNL